MKFQAAISTLVLTLYQVSSVRGQSVVMSICEDFSGGTRFIWGGAITSQEGLVSGPAGSATNVRFGGADPGGHASIFTQNFQQWLPDGSGLADFSGFQRVATPTSVDIDDSTFTLTSDPVGNSFGLYQDTSQGIVYFSQDYTVGDTIEGNLLVGSSFADLGLIDGATSTVSWGPTENRQSYTILVNQASCLPICTLIEPTKTCLIPVEAPPSSKGVMMSRRKRMLASNNENSVRGISRRHLMSMSSSSSIKTTTTPPPPIEGIQVCIYVTPVKESEVFVKSKGGKGSKKEDAACVPVGPFFETRCVESLDDLADNEEIVNCGCCNFVEPLTGQQVCIQSATQLV